MDIREIGVKENRIKVLASKGFETVEDVQNFFPRTYYDFSVQKSLDPVYDDTWSAVIGTIDEVSTKKTNNVLMLKAKVLDEMTGKKLHVMWIGAYYLYNIIKDWEGEKVIVCGKLTYNEEFHSFHMNNPIVFDKNIEKNLRIYPVYKKMSKISEDYMDNLVKEALKKPIVDTVPEDVVRRHRLMDLRTAISTMHHPKSMDELNKARQRMVYDKLLRFALQMEVNDRSVSKGTIYNIKNVKNTEDYIRNLPYELTPSQAEVYEKMKKMAINGRRINALIQGDVGSGKTTSAFLMMFAMADSGYQSLIMAPTVILAKQHYDNLEKEAGRYGYRVAYLAGKQTEKEKREIRKGIENGYYQFIVGTHSVISDSVTYNNLALAIIDEEHKFGVKQRELLADKAKFGVHSISMSATPIPRTIATTMYGNNIEVCDLQVPATRNPVQTAINSSNKVIFDFIEKKMASNQQVYVVCPFIEDEDNKYGVETVESSYAEYSKYFNRDGKNIVGCVTGKMKAEESDAILDEFKKGNLKILISTTIIEVGVNVPTANVIVINNAERFGLAQLHQLRGRVGRGSDPGYCILKSTDKENARLNILCKTTNGYEIAEEDMKLRGTGNLLGTEQSGQNEYIDLVIQYPNMYRVIKEDAKMLVNRGVVLYN